MNRLKFQNLFFEALRIRLIEETIVKLYPSDQIQSPVHLSIGQEAVAVGLSNNLRQDDWVFINYRGHAYYLAQGAPLGPFFAELMGRAGGLSGGKAGSMHLAAPDHGVMGASAVVGSTISHAVGAALASKMRHEKRVFVSVFGDGALEQGVVHEALNLAALYRTPVLFLCEDNGLAVHSHIKERQAFDIQKFVTSHGVKYYELEDSFDLLKTANKFAEIVEKVRINVEPVFFKIRTMRYNEHVGPGHDFKAGYRSETEIIDWKENDPLIKNIKLFEKFEDKIRNEIEEALEWARATPFPTKEDLLTHVI